MQVDKVSVHHDYPVVSLGQACLKSARKKYNERYLPKLILQSRGNCEAHVVAAEFAHIPLGKFIKKHVLPGSETENDI